MTSEDRSRVGQDPGRVKVEAQSNKMTKQKNILNFIVQLYPVNVISSSAIDKLKKFPYQYSIVYGMDLM